MRLAVWRTACSVAGSLLAAGGLPALASTRATTPSITIAATSKPEVTGDAVVLYRAANSAYTTAKISGAGYRPAGLRRGTSLQAPVPALRVPAGRADQALDKRATVSRSRRIAADEYERTAGVSFWIGSDSVRSFLVGAKDSEARDGIGLPGQHGCGAKRARSNVLYLG